MGIASLETLIAPDVITAKYIKFAEDDLSGNYIKGGIITDFSSTGIIDQATKQTLHLDDEGLSVDNIYTNNVDASKINDEIIGHVKILKKTEGIVKTIGVGDNYNDLEMLKNSDFPCLVFNDKFLL